jgi:hypothetical protein
VSEIEINGEKESVSKSLITLITCTKWTSASRRPPTRDSEKLLGLLRLLGLSDLLGLLGLSITLITPMTLISLITLITLITLIAILESTLQFLYLLNHGVGLCGRKTKINLKTFIFAVR